MKKIFLALLLLTLPGLLAAQEILEKIEILGNDRVTPETILYYVTVREGETYSADQFRRDFRVLWSTGFFSNITFEESQGTRGRIVRITVEENPVVRAMTFKTGKKVKEGDIVKKLKEKDQAVLPYSYYSPLKVQRIKDTITDLLFEKGLLASKIDTEIVKQGKNEVDVLIRIDEGPKVRVGDVLFEGSTKLAASRLKWSMKDNRPHSLFNWITAKDVYKQNKISEDIDLIKKKYQEKGYMEAAVGQPRTEEIVKRSVLFKKQKMMRLVIPVTPGYLYRTGEIKIEGSKALNVKFLRSLVKLKPGEVYSTKDREKSVEDISEVFRDGGFVYAQVIPVENLDPKRKIVNVTFNIVEGEVAYLNRLEFRGNNYTKDKVIRREMIIREGDRFSFSLFKNSILRVKQLGLVDLEKDPDIKPNPDDPTKMDVQVNVKELQRNNIQFTAGYSGYEGTFLAFSYSTVNFLGAGETLELSIQQGKLVKNYSFGFSEPYLFDKPITAGFNIYKRDLRYPWFWRKGTGIDLITGTRLFGMWRANLTYTYERVQMTIPSLGDDSGTTPTLPPYYGYGNQKYNQSSISPMLWRSTIDSPLTPTRGTQYSASLKYAFNFLGGDIFLLKPQLEFTHYHPLFGRGPKAHVVGFHAQYQFVKALHGSQIPYWEKFFLGGERSVRGYEVYTIGPVDANGYNLGGEKAVVLNAEYIIPVGGPLYAIFFYDRGNAIPYSQKLSFKDMYSSLGIEARLFIPALRVPFRLIFAYNNRKIYATDSNFAFRFAVGTTF
ncbi:MAG: outer membrane protein assembly factor BamA [Candidatus Aminicenantes bacterium RBG_19FT_COMBO_65_30]|nr:MAG: outer membrane protein assembly factor BamA [Candidatus Aminicenantes bacterium RBG_19FT_COMBO_65_30]